VEFREHYQERRRVLHLDQFGAVGGGIAGLLGWIFGGQNNDDANKHIKMLFDAYNKVGTLPIYPIHLYYKGLKQSGTLTPELLQKLNLEEDKSTNLVENPEDKQNQQNALNALQQMSQTGLTAADRAAFNQLRSQTGSDTKLKLIKFFNSNKCKEKLLVEMLWQLSFLLRRALIKRFSRCG